MDSGISEPALVMALDEAFLTLSANGDGKAPILHFYRKTPSISVGYFQTVERTVDLEECHRRNVGIYRRKSGGGTIYEDEDQLIYGLVVPDYRRYGIPGNRVESFRYLNGAITSALSKLGLSAEYAPVNDILVNGRKISGCAQTRKGEALLQHGTVILRHDPAIMFSLLKVDPGKLKEKGLTDPVERVTSVERELDGHVVLEDLKRLLAGEFSRLLGIPFKPSGVTHEESEHAHELVMTRYSRGEWNFMR